MGWGPGLTGPPDSRYDTSMSERRLQLPDDRFTPKVRKDPLEAVQEWASQRGFTLTADGVTDASSAPGAGASEYVVTLRDPGVPGVAITATSRDNLKTAALHMRMLLEALGARFGGPVMR